MDQQLAAVNVAFRTAGASLRNTATVAHLIACCGRGAGAGTPLPARDVVTIDC